MFKTIRYGMMLFLLVIAISSQAVSGPSLVDCDVTFVQVPTLNNMSAGSAEALTVTIKNNTPVSVALLDIHVINNGDNQPDTAVIIDPTVTNSCGAELASGASCNLELNFQPTVAGNLNRTLFIGIDTRQISLQTTFTASVSGSSFPVPITACVTQWAAYAATAILNSGATIINHSNLGTCPGTAITGFPPGQFIGGGSIHAADAVACGCQTELQNTFNALQNLTPTQFLFSGVLDGLTFGPGVYEVFDDLVLDDNAILTLDGQNSPSSTFVFQTPFGLRIGNFASIVLINGASANNVFWTVAASEGEQVTLGQGSLFQGSIVAEANAIIMSNATIFGRVLAVELGNTVNLNSDVITPPTS